MIDIYRCIAQVSSKHVDSVQMVKLMAYHSCLEAEGRLFLEFSCLVKVLELDSNGSSNHLFSLVSVGNTLLKIVLMHVCNCHKFRVNISFKVVFWHGFRTLKRVEPEICDIIMHHKESEVKACLISREAEGFVKCCGHFKTVDNLLISLWSDLCHVICVLVERRTLRFKTQHWKYSCFNNFRYSFKYFCYSFLLNSWHLICLKVFLKLLNKKF